MSADPAINAALINFCMKADDGPKDKNRPLPKRDPEDYKFLREAIASVEAPEKRCKKLLETATSKDASENELIAALEELADMVEDMNMAREFNLMKGPVKMMFLFKQKSEATIRQLCATVMANSAQNDEELQKAYNDLKWAAVIVPQLLEEKNAPLKNSLLQFCSSMVRGNIEGTKQFLDCNGLNILSSLLREYQESPILEKDHKLARRVFFLCDYFAQCGVSTSYVIEASCQCAVPTPNEEGGDETVHQNAAGCVLSLLTHSPQSVKDVAEKMMLPHKLDHLDPALVSDTEVFEKLLHKLREE